MPIPGALHTRQAWQILHFHLRHEAYLSSFTAQMERTSSEGKMACSDAGTMSSSQCESSSEGVADRSADGLQEINELLPNVEGEGPRP